MMLSDESLKLIPPKIKDEEASIAAEMVCSICCSIPHVDPMITPCQHIFCRDCILQALARCRRCPNCREPGHRWIRNEHRVTRLEGVVNRIWQSIPVECPSNGCHWKGSMGDYKAHASNCSSSLIVKRLSILEENNAFWKMII